MTKHWDYKLQQWVEDMPQAAPESAKWPEPSVSATQGETVDLPKWPYASIEAAAPSASNERKEVNVTEQNKEVNIEDPTMLSAFFAKLSNKVVEASELGKRVADLEAKVRELDLALSEARGNVEMERQGRLETERTLQDFRNRLDHEQRAVHDLVVERDMERDAKGQAQTTLALTQKDMEFWSSEAARYERERNEAQHASDVCREQREQMAKQVAALREAFGALRVIG